MICAVKAVGVFPGETLYVSDGEMVKVGGVTPKPAPVKTTATGVVPWTIGFGNMLSIRGVAS
jgi:hypothetical protein